MESISIIDETIDPLYMSIPVPASRNFIDQIYEFNQKAGLLDKPYDDFLESSFQIEEALEGFEHSYGWKEYLLPALFGNDTQYQSPKNVSRYIVNMINRNCWETCCPVVISDVDRLDKACDAIVFAVGSIAKLKLTPTQLNEAMSIVMNANLAKLGMPKDEHGKLMKPEGFVGPEVQLQALLDRRTSC